MPFTHCRLTLVAMVVLVLSCNDAGKSDSTASDSTNVPSSDTSVVAEKDSLDAELATIRFCTERLPYPQRQFKKLYDVDTIVKRNDSTHAFDTALKPIKGQERPYISSLNGYVWNKNRLKVAFLDGEPTVQQRVQQAVRAWEAVCAVRFEFGPTTDPDITISFNNQGFWSNIGSDSKGRSPSMSLTGLYANMPEQDFNGVVLHEFGHAMGFVHEHQTQGFNIPWNVSRVERYYRVKYGWNEQMTYDNVIFKYEFGQTNGSAFDPKSIMVYAIPRGLTVDPNFFVDWTYELSPIDKQIVAQRYR